MVLMIDNFDSFTYNIVHYLEELGARVEVFRNNRITVAEVRDLKPSHIVISPGPGRPMQAGCSKEIIEAFKAELPLLGVCLGLQCIGEVFSRRVVRSQNILHGKTSQIYHRGVGVFKGIKSPFRATRYHSLIIEKADDFIALGDEATKKVSDFVAGNKELMTVKPRERSDGSGLEVIAWSEEQEIMGVCHHGFPGLYGVQFHPESIASEYGHKLLENFLALSLS